ncbi:MAG TPA: PQQ-dependent sugar dehydrogenase [Candidatus Aquabacterium excrementipullorum]|nr:PQQ-dependent sugar dehydrogenase [Candidatus Aquabacterium excrementipullorum]
MRGVVLNRKRIASHGGKRGVWRGRVGAALMGLMGLGSGLAAGPGELSPAGGAPLVAFTVDTVASGLDHPWGLAFLPDGRMLVTERAGRLRVVDAHGTVSAAVTGLPANIDVQGQGGLLDVVLDPNFAANRRVYLSYAEAGTGSERGTNGTSVWRGELSASGAALRNGTVIFRQRPKVASALHFGGRLVFARDGTLFITMGERSSRPRDAQDKSNLLGKVARINTDGSVPADNPLVGTGGAATEIWSWGHRNVQGAALHPGTGVLWTNEHGPQGGDELNIDRAGRNYGWPVITYGCTYGACNPIGEGTAKAGMEQPVTWWPKPSTAPSGLMFYTGAGFAPWRGNAFIGALAGQVLWRLTLSGDTVTSREALLSNRGERYRTVVQGPDGWIYLLTDDGNGKVLRLRAP